MGNMKGSVTNPHSECPNSAEISSRPTVTARLTRMTSTSALYLHSLLVGAALRQLRLKNDASVHVNKHQGDIIGGRALAPRSHAVEDSLLHLLERQESSLADEFLHAFDAQHLPARTE